jgi:adenosylcobinamide-GDP ribazoletransferase
VSSQWRLFLTALRYFTRIPASTWKGVGEIHPNEAARFVPLVGVLVGAVGGCIYWIGALLWPSSVAVILSLFATALISGNMSEDAFAKGSSLDINPSARAGSLSLLGLVFVLLIKYNALMALSAASLPFPLPANLALGFFMICGHAASRALVVSVIATRTQTASPPVSNGDLSLALLFGFAPATLLGIPGLIGLAAAIVMRMACGAYVKRILKSVASDALDATQQLTEACFYLGALATWTYS